MKSSFVHKRSSIRLRDYDYSKAGAYFVTLCSYKREPVFGNIIGEEMHLNEFGKIVESEWLLSSEIRLEIELDEFIVMPNHFHAIVFIQDVRIDDNSPIVGANDPSSVVGANGRSPLQMKPRSLSSMISGYKSSVTSKINMIRGTRGKPLWQRNYYEHIIRNQRSLDFIRQYIVNNPLRWAYDRDNPDGKPDREEIDFWKRYS